MTNEDNGMLTNEEAIKILRETAWLECGNGEKTYKALNMGIEALQKQEKYKWHDLRKNPEDLPERGTHIVYLYLFKRDGHGRSILSSNTCYYGRHSLDDWGAYKYIAWKECGFEEFEPFEEE